jgi:L-lactate dehydrogenase complex protein LldG
LRQVALTPGGAFATLLTGPSRTADIERVLTVGVQGPGKVMTLFVDDL